MTALVRLEPWAARFRPGRMFLSSHGEACHPEFVAGLGVAFVAAGAYWHGGWRWGVAGLLAAALLAWAARSRLGRIHLPSHRETFHPEFLASLVVAFVAAGAYWYGGWRWGVAGLLAGALLVWRLRAWQNGSSLSPAKNGRG